MSVIRYGDDTVVVRQTPGEREKSPMMAPVIWAATFAECEHPLDQVLIGHGGSEQAAVERLYDLLDQWHMLKALGRD